MPRTADPNAKIPRLVCTAKPGWEEDIKAFKKVCVRDGLEIGEELHDLVVLWLRRHNYPPGNPQKLLMELEKQPFKYEKGKVYCYERKEKVWLAMCLNMCPNRETCEIAVKVREMRNR